MCMQVLREKMDVLRLTFYTAPVSVGILVPFFLATELRKLMSYGCAGFCSHQQSSHIIHASKALQAGFYADVLPDQLPLLCFWLASLPALS